MSRAWSRAPLFFVALLTAGLGCRGVTDAGTTRDQLGAPQNETPAAPPTTPQTPPPGNPPERPADIPGLPHATDFLTAGCRTQLYPGLDAAERDRCRRLMKERGYTHFYVYVYNELDYGGPSFDFFADPQRYRQLLLELKNDGLAPVVWLVPDDAPAIAGTPAHAIQAKFQAFVPVVDDLVSSYVLGLELDEHWQAPMVDALGKHLSALTSKPIAVHQLPGRWQYCEFAWCDYLILQYGFDKSPAEVEALTRAAIAALRKPVVAGEYELIEEARAVALGNVGVAAGASGFGNGGTKAPPQ